MCIRDTTSGGRKDADDDGREDPEVVLERLVRAENSEPRQRERFEECQRLRAELFLAGRRVPIDRQAQQTHQQADDQIGRVEERRGNLIEQDVACYSTADAAKEGHDQQSCLLYTS